MALLSPVPYLLAFALLASPSSAHGTSSSNSGKVSLDLYYESLCPYSANFIINYLPKIFEDDLISIVDLSLVPWGNAKLRSNDSFTCQHGPEECILNTVEACAIHVWPRLDEHFSFIYCIETLVYERKHSEWESCFEKLGLDKEPITDCYASGIGRQLELEHAAATNALQPPHEYVPWVVVNGEPLYEDYENFESYICKVYRGAAVPKACNKLKPVVNHVKAANLIHPVCYREQTSVLPRWIRSVMTWWMSE